MFLWYVTAHPQFFQTKAFEIRMDTFSQFCFDITLVSSRLPSLSQPSFCVGLIAKIVCKVYIHSPAWQRNEFHLTEELPVVAIGRRY